MLQQDEFDRFVESYNGDYFNLLTRASRGDYTCLISSFTVLKDLHDVIFKLHDTLELDFRVVPYPLTFRGSDELLASLGFDADEVVNIYEFLEFVQQTQGKAFEQVIQEGVPVKCARIGSPP
jgi:hypothetical protein